MSVVCVELAGGAECAGECERKKVRSVGQDVTAPPPPSSE